MSVVYRCFLDVSKRTNSFRLCRKPTDRFFNAEIVKQREYITQQKEKKKKEKHRRDWISRETPVVGIRIFGETDLTTRSVGTAL